MDEFDKIEQDYMEAHPGAVQSVVALPNAEIYPLALAQTPAMTPAAPPAEPFYVRRLGPLPVWAWAAIAAAGGGAYWWWSSQKKVESNPDGESPALPEETSSSGWNPSRSGFGDKLKLHLAKQGKSDGVTIYTDADEAKRKLKYVSPLVTMHCEVDVPVKPLDKWCRREGLTAVSHEGGIIGFYPANSGKKAKAWEEYIDALRDDGQTV